MAFRGRGRGRAGGGFGGFSAKQLPFELFPEIEGLDTASNVKEAKTLAVWYSKFEKYSKSSPYYIEDGNDTSKKLGTELETFFNHGSEKNKPKGRLSDFIKMDPVYVPAELAKGEKKGRHGVKRVRWDAGSDMKLDDLFSKSLQDEVTEEKKKAAEKENKGKKDKKEEEEEEEEEEENNEEDDDEYSDNDYNQNEDFDDDEDDFNPPDDGGADEDVY